MQGARVQSVVGELRPCMPHGVAKRLKKKKGDFATGDDYNEMKFLPVLKTILLMD